MLLTTSLTAALAIGLTSAHPATQVLKRSASPELVNGKYIVDRQSQFANSATYTFDGDSLPDGLYKSTYSGDTHGFSAANAYLEDGYLNLLVNGGQTQMPYTCGEVTTVVENIKYASVRTVAILTEPAGVCNGTSPTSLVYFTTHRNRHVLLPIRHPRDRHRVAF